MVGGWRWWEVLLATRATLTYVCVRQGLRLRKWWWHRGLRGQATTPWPQTCLHYYFKSRAGGQREKIIPRRFVHSTVRPDPLVFFFLFPPLSATRSILHALITSSTQCSSLPHPQSLAGFSRAGVRVPRYPVSSPCPSRNVYSSILSIAQVHSRLPTLFTGNLRVTVEYSSVSTLRRSTFSTSGDGRRGRGVKRVVSTSSILAR